MNNINDNRLMIPQRTTATHKVIDFLTKRKLHFDKVLEYPHAKGGLIVWVCTNTKTIKNFKPIVWMTDEFVIVYVYYPNINILYENDACRAAFDGVGYVYDNNVLHFDKKKGFMLNQDGL
jgi:hypothetical protein